MFSGGEDPDDQNQDELKGLFKRLGEIINETLASSKEVQEILKQIKDFGLGVDLSMVMGLGLYYRPDMSQNFGIDNDETQNGNIKFEITSGDEKFLRQNRLGLAIDNDNIVSKDSEDINP